MIYCKDTDPPSNTDRKLLLAQIIDATANSDIILLPAGYYQCKKINSRKHTAIIKDITQLLQKANSRTVICVGIDYRDKKDQLSYAVGTQGIIAAGRKFYLTAEERNSTEMAVDYIAKEGGVGRVFQVNEFSCYLAVCYDCFGIRHLNIENPGIDILLDLVHGFNRQGLGASGDVDFARKGFAGASMQWKCPVFGTAVFFGREVPKNWPTGILWYGAESVKFFKYADNLMTWTNRLEIAGEKETAIIYKYAVIK